MKVRLGGRAVTVTPKMAIGKGGEADVYALPDGRALKLYKTEKHPDYKHMPLDQRAAKQRIAEHQSKLPAFPAGLSGRVVVPEELAVARRGGAIVGYAMAMIAGAQPLFRLSDPRHRKRPGIATSAVSAFRDLFSTVESLHSANVVIGDFNDLNVLVRDDRAFVIDADSFQFGPYPCRVFTERFVDPLLCDPAGSSLTLMREHGSDSDWYAFAVMLMRSLLCVGPYGGVHRPRSGSAVPHGRRPLERLTVFAPEVVYPKPAIHYGTLPDDLLHYFHGLFERDDRGDFPATLLDRLRFTSCSQCGAEHARGVCPGCTRRAAPRPPAMVRGKVSAVRVRGLKFPDPHANADHRYWIDGSVLYRDDTFGPKRIGDVLDSARFWVGSDFGVGFYRAGLLTVGFVFDAERGGLDDGVALPSISGNLIDAHAVFGSSRAWLFWLEQRRGRLLTHCAVLARDGTTLCVETARAGERPWMWAGFGACAAGEHLFVPTDDGIVRVELEGGAVEVTRRFLDTEPFVDSECRLSINANGLHVFRPGGRPDEALRLSMN